MIKPAGNPEHGDYQANCAMPLGKKHGKPPLEIADELVGKVKLDDFCQTVETDGKIGFVNLKLDDDWVKSKLTAALADERLGVEKIGSPRTYVVDYSSPNVAKPMHVGHIRSTVIGDALTKVLRFVGHKAISDNHIGDWGTQFGMIIYGYKNFVDKDAYAAAPVTELGRLYKYVRKLMDYHSAVAALPKCVEAIKELEGIQSELESKVGSDDKKAEKKLAKQIKAAKKKVTGQQDKVKELEAKIAEVDGDSSLKSHADAHPNIGQAVLEETADLHRGDETNKQLWLEFLPSCRQDIQKIYNRLDIEFDHELGESFYHEDLANVVNNLEAKGFTRISDEAVCVFLDNHATPMIVKKRDGAFLYATTDLATIKYRMENWNSDACLYVVDHRQSEHFEKLFDVAAMWGYSDSELKHVSFGTVLGDDGTPFKTRSGDTVGLESLLDEAESRALVVAKEQNAELPSARHDEILSLIHI